MKSRIFGHLISRHFVGKEHCYTYMKSLLIFTILILVSSANACEKVQGNYSSLSETHWGYVLQIKNNNATLISKDYWHGESGTRTDTQVTSQGYCKHIKANEYEFRFAEQTILMQYHSSLSQKSFGGSGSSTGFTSKQLIENQVVELWSSIK